MIPNGRFSEAKTHEKRTNQYKKRDDTQYQIKRQNHKSPILHAQIRDLLIRSLFRATFAFHQISLSAFFPLRRRRRPLTAIFFSRP